MFQREGNDIHHTIPLSFLESLCGWTRTFTCIDEKQLVVASAGPTGPEWRERYPGLGMPNTKEPTERGDLVIRVSTPFPLTPLTEDQKKALKEIFPE